jgi:FecR protein
MNTLVFAVMMQVASTSFIVSTKAGVINYAQGATTVKPATVAKAGQAIGTGPNGRVEVLLNPGSYLRMGENSQVILEKVQLYDIAVRMVQGSSLIESNGFTKDVPLSVKTGNLKMQIIKDGIYLFSDGKVVVVKGKIRNAGNGLTYGEGFQISDDQGFRAQKVKTFTTSLELWSQQRDAQIASANLNIARSLNQTSGVPVGSFQNVWLWSTLLGSFIYMPGGGYRSPYGYSYQPIVPYYPGGFGGGGGNGRANGQTASNTTNNNQPAVDSSSSFGPASGARGFGAAGGAPAASPMGASGNSGSRGGGAPVRSSK